MCYPIFRTTCPTISGEIIYSDSYCFYDHRENEFGAPAGTLTQKVTPLSRLAALPIVGIVAGVNRVALAVIHIFIHTLSGIFSHPDHFYHVAKGFTELLRGAIEMIPVIGRIFVWVYDAKLGDIDDFENGSALPRSSARWSFFLIKISNPQAPDEIDRRILGF